MISGMPAGFRLLIALALIVALLPVPPGAGRAQSAIEVQETKVEYTFGGQVTFWARVTLPASPEEALVFYRPKGDERTLTGSLTVNGDQVVFVHDLTQKPLRAFAETEYWFGFRLPDGENYISPTYSFTYIDNRFPWQQLQDNSIEVNWYDGDLAFGQMALDVLRNGLASAQKLVDLPSLQPVKLYIYASGPEMQSTMRLGAFSMVGGHASPDLGVMIVTLPPGPDQRVEMERQVPHELMHVLLYQKLSQGYDNLPAWLNEGIASQNEFYPNPDYNIILKDASQRETLLPLTSLCKSFPLDAASFFLGYAEAESFVRFLYAQYGKSGIEALITQYVDGVECGRGAELALGNSLTDLEAQWLQSTFGLTSTPPAQVDNPLLPWIVLAGIMLIVPLGVVLSSMMAPTRRKSAGSSTAAGGGG